MCTYSSAISAEDDCDDEGDEGEGSSERDDEDCGGLAVHRTAHRTRGNDAAAADAEHPERVCTLAEAPPAALSARVQCC